MNFMDFRLLYRKTLDRISEGGIRAVYDAARKYLGRSTTDKFDVTWGTDTSGIVALWSLKTTSRNAIFGHPYEATDEQELVQAVGLLGEDLGTFTFIDLGCGKGRTLIVAGQLGFGKVLGVEFAAELVEIARKNLAKLGLTGVVVQADAADFQFPSSDLIVYLFNPFSRKVMERVVANLRICEAKELYVIYNNPNCAEILDSSGFLKRFGLPLATSLTIQIWKKVYSGTHGN